MTIGMTTGMTIDRHFKPRHFNRHVREDGVAAQHSYWGGGWPFGR